MTGMPEFNAGNAILGVLIAREGQDSGMGLRTLLHDL
jgi:hypothetical protein